MADTECRNCSEPAEGDLPACKDCYRDPETNKCALCNHHLQGIPYPFVCGTCLPTHQKDTQP
jgi:hypothetical protein